MFHRRLLAFGAAAAILAAACGGTTPTTTTTSATASALPAASVEPFDEAKLLAAAKNEPPLVAVNNSGIVTTIAQLFEQKDGLQVNGTKARQQKYGSWRQTTEKNAGYEFIKRLAANKPILGKSDDDAAAAVGAPGQKAAPVGMMSLGKHGEAPGKGNKLGVCKGIQPFLGFAYPRYAVIVKGTPSPNAARL